MGRLVYMRTDCNEQTDEAVLGRKASVDGNKKNRLRQKFAFSPKGWLLPRELKALSPFLSFPIPFSICCHHHTIKWVKIILCELGNLDTMHLQHFLEKKIVQVPNNFN